VTVETTRPRIGLLVTFAVVVAGVTTGALALLAMPDTAEPSGTGASPGRAASPGGTSEDGAPYAFWALDHLGGPLRWDACSPIRFIVNLNGAPEHAERDVRRALDVLARASGLDLALEGLTDETPDAQRPLVGPDGSGWRWMPVLIAWALPGSHGLELSAPDRGIALPVAVRDEGRETYVTGQVVLNAARPDLVPGFEDRRTSIGATLLHEIAHVLGLDHVDDPAQLMSVDPGSGPVAFGSGDLAGLRRIGASAGCTPAPPASAGRGLVVTR
jgi:hypothetical protein